MNISLQATLTEADEKDLFGWSDIVFPIEGRGMDWAALRWHVVARDEERAVGHIGFDQFTIRDDGRETRVIGVGGVVVRPEHQRQGIPARMFATLHADAPEKTGADTFSLFCPARLVPSYQRHGYSPINRPVSILQRGRATQTPFTFMVRGPSVSPVGPALDIPSLPW